jgi:FAD:protein FMN transferase
VNGQWRKGEKQNWHWRKLIVLSCLTFLVLFRSTAGAECLSDGQYVMGTVLQVTLCEADPAIGELQMAALFTSARRLDAELTTFSPTSPVNRLNTRAGHGRERVSPQLAHAIAVSLDYWRMTKGTFDITVGPLMALWREAAETGTIPSPATFRRVRSQVGSKYIRLGADGTVSLTRPNMALDFGGIGKGYALDQLANVLRAQKQKSALLSFGQSSIWALGRPPDAPGWRLLLRGPQGESSGLVTLTEQALSVSASFGQSVQVHGQSYGHIIDPRTGRPLKRNLVAYVTAPNAAQAEALSKALLVLGEQQGIVLLQSLNEVEGLLLEANGQRWMTTGWRDEDGRVGIQQQLQVKCNGSCS